MAKPETIVDHLGIMALPPLYPEPSRNLVFERWAKHIDRVLKAESELVGEMTKQSTLIGNAREALIEGVLRRFIPPIYEIGTGQVIDSSEGGEPSKQMDIIIARKDFPVLRFPDGAAQYLIESVVATIEIKSDLSSKTLEQALDNCYSLGELVPAVESGTLAAVLKNIFPNAEVEFQCEPGRPIEMRKKPNGKWNTRPSYYMQQLQAAIRPKSYIFSFDGYRQNVDAFAAQIEKWLDSKEKSALPNEKSALPNEKCALPDLPSVIAAHGCIALRNVRGVTIDEADTTWPLVLVDKHENPLAVLVDSLLRTIQEAVSVPPTTLGLRFTPEAYLQMPSNEWSGLKIASRPTFCEDDASSLRDHSTKQT